MKVTIIGHAYSASYNRKDKLVRMAKHPDVDSLQLIVPRTWYDKPLEMDRSYHQESFDGAYRIDPVGAMFTSSQPKYVFNPVQLFSAIHSFNPDVLYIEQEPHDLVSAQIALMNMTLFRKPIVMFTWENTDRSFSLPRQILRTQTIQNMSGFVAGNSEAVELLGRTSNKPMTVIPQFGVDVERFKPMNVDGLKIEFNLDNAFVLGFVGRYTKDKGIHTLIDACKKVRTLDHQEVILVCVSSMSPPEWILQAQEECGDSLRLLSNIDHHDFPKYMNVFDALVLPSETTSDWKEQFGRVVIEAAACGIPTIGSSSGAIPEVIGENGIIFKEKDVDDLSRVISAVLSKQASLPSSEAIRNSTVQNYSHDVIVNKLISFLKEVYDS